MELSPQFGALFLHSINALQEITVDRAVPAMNQIATHVLQIPGLSLPQS
jgi:hypothetical protein